MDLSFINDRLNKTVKKLRLLKVENYMEEQDQYFVKNLLTPYLSAVYTGLVNRQNKDYLSISKAKSYLNLPPLIGDRIVRQLNANGDERIDHDEFIKFFLKLLMGTLP